ncbi:hypothetical protein HMPREF9333_02011 [Johnsonella ignava ATCC 51276]|uniref:DUF434 domain-containing protein n=1 Tax=Johnsonella ignava ATCC 51276 TaxID=679200 RepID=G5GKC0_9FIRM|nr:DUF434 domain-containing protein [Johnsonella ignava]EHI54810.1 hypothetical protein HMPREF9333_02011 [Johnsonella ignava ATCC 51276]
MNAKRGYVPEDDRNFSPEALKTLQTASRHILYLINEGYDIKQASTFVGNHFLISERQRLAIVRSLATDTQLQNRQKKQLSIKDISGTKVWIDGFNTIITLEIFLSDSILLTGMDGTIRDLASLRGTYRMIPETYRAIQMMFDVLQNANVIAVNILLDEPVSNSGRLKSLIADIAEKYPFALYIQLLKDVDRKLYNKDNVITSDSVILDHCNSWINLTAECLRLKGKSSLKVW